MDLQSQKYIPLALTSIDIIFILLILLISCFLFNKALAPSPAFDQNFITDENTSDQRSDWVQTYGNDSSHLRSDYTNLLAVDYLSDGKNLDTTFWLASNLENASTYSQPLKRIRYGMLIAIGSLLQLQDIMEPITTFISKQLMENGVNIFTNYHLQVLLRL